MNWHNHQYVTHDKRPQWGVGKVFDANARDFKVFFADSGWKNFMQGDVPLSVAPLGAPISALFDHLASLSIQQTNDFVSLPDCIKRFQKLFPQGFSDPAYLTEDAKVGERSYKLAASDFATQTLSEDAWRGLNSSGQFAEVCHRLEQIEAKTNLLHKFEKIKWHRALSDERLQRPLSEAIFNDIYGVGDRRRRFESLKAVLGDAEGCAKWTVATYYGFLLLPRERIFIKPEVTKYAALACGWDLQYDSELNWNTLSSAEKLVDYLFAELTRRGLAPRDMIDVQSFIWCIEPKSYA